MFETKSTKLKSGKTSVNGNGLAKQKANQKTWEYAKSPESKDHINLKNRYELFINGKWQGTGKYFDTINPANEDKISEVAYASKDDVDKAVRSASNAFAKVWSKI